MRNFKIYAVGVTVIISGKLFNANVRDRSLDLGVDGRITLRWIQSKTGYTHLRISMADLSEHNCESSRSTKGGEFLDKLSIFDVS